MVKIKKKYLAIIIGISLLAVITGIIFNANTIIMSALIGIFIGGLVQFFIHNKEQNN
ncbi:MULTISPECIES: hypothetical protein [Chryseobacterium]|jgi:uncharacterized membrane protein YdjX (TVP38/TMEM64 family)|uniref:Uncharacterized protein n=1 Tax=Chryseobacterium aquaticum TaxID=452084 RepID=A0A848N3S0_9FLAO|nr:MULTISPECIES: hypothetical protein [Chryseobacterium]NMR33408.1 hypothetical protein [Chryseobacterium aquaticum]NRQ44661.1 hypothetical protein [Chryseobacterium sp. C-204]